MWLKQKLAWVLIVLMSINSFAAVVGDNDGAAFITKAEFESLKNDFQTQINRYNSLLDNKIDGAIASYLNGIKIETQRLIEPLVSNYELMRWQPNWKVYGKYKKYRDYSNFTELTSNQWFTPNANERRMITRYKTFVLGDNIASALSNGSIFFTGNISDWGDGLLPEMGNFNQDKRSCGPLVIHCQPDKEEDYVYRDKNVFYNLGGTGYSMYTYPHFFIKCGSDANWQMSYTNWYLNDPNTYLNFETPGPGEVMRYWIKLSGGIGDKRYEYRSIIYSKYAIFPTYFGSWSAFDGDDVYANTNTAFYANGETLNTHSDAVCARGLTWHLLDDTYQDELVDSFYYMMLGKDNDQTVNKYKIKHDSITDAHAYELSDEYVTATVSFTGVSVMSDSGWTTDKTVYPASGKYAINKDVQINFPLLPVATLSELSNGEFIYNKRALKFGEGLPLAVDTNTNGYLQVSFDYDVKYTLDSASKNKRIVFSVKKDDYLINNAGFIEGYTALVDPKTTIQTQHLFKDYAYENSTGHLDFTIPISKEDSIWFRMSPQDDTGGYYATMKNLRVKLISS